MATPVNTTTGVVYLVGWSGTISGGSLILSGTLQLADGSAAAPSLAFTSDTDLGVYRSGPNTLTFVNGSSVTGAELTDAAWVVPSGSFMGWSNHATTIPGSTADVRIYRDAANTLALRNGTSAQAFNLYGTYTSATNYERVALRYNNSRFELFAQAGSGGGTARALHLGTNDTTRWSIHGTTGVLSPSANYSASLTFSALGVTSTDGLILANSTAASAGTQQMSPRLRFDGFGWKTDATASSQAVSFINELLPVQGAAAPTANLLWKYAVNGGAYSTIATLNSAGAFDAVSYKVGGATGASFGPGVVTSITVVNGIVTAIS